MDDLDRRILHALGLDGRASFSRIATLLDVSDQTVARRYRRLRTRGVARVVGLCDLRRTGGCQWWVRLQCTPGAAPAIAAALARRPDTTWVQLLSGGTEILCGVQTVTSEIREPLLLDRLPRSSRITSVAAYSLLHTFAGGMMNDGLELLGALTEEQVRRFAPTPRPPVDDVPTELDDLDRSLFAVLAKDARLTHAELAVLVGWSESTVRRRMERLEETGVLYYDLEIDTAMLGLHACAWLWLAVHPSALAAVGTAIARHPETAFAAATTGPTNLAASIVCRDIASLYRHLSERVGTLEGVQHVETVPIVRTVKQGGAVLPNLGTRPSVAS
ncbi:DNA-binding Lrp family transcriptional regulator [Thermomonospora umbrina]|uniref:DNA-binding Lrp family transcriptional regulator n=1 Tax=Thermomonospora umbrina TaxID=111806 RepID=A0A3D9SSF3_9ACTN|nr:DNA-binding Lrp family transcriptional regulator [Thermomonospora umbrina]